MRKSLEKYSLLELIALEGKFKNRLPEHPSSVYLTPEEWSDQKDIWDKENGLTERTVWAIQQEINDRMEALQNEISKEMSE